MGAGAALLVVAAFVVSAADDDTGETPAWAASVVLAIVGGLGLFLAPVVIQVRRAMDALRQLRSSLVPVLGNTVAFVLGASLVFAGAYAVEGFVGEVDPPVIDVVLWWWPLALSAVVVVGVTEGARRGVRRWVASRRSRHAGGNGSA